MMSEKATQALVALLRTLQDEHVTYFMVFADPATGSANHVSSIVDVKEVTALLEQVHARVNSDSYQRERIFTGGKAKVDG